MPTLDDRGFDTLSVHHKPKVSFTHSMERDSLDHMDRDGKLQFSKLGQFPFGSVDWVASRVARLKKCICKPEIVAGIAVYLTRSFGRLLELAVVRSRLPLSSYFYQTYNFIMCKRVDCPNDGKPTWWGCGESVHELSGYCSVTDAE